MTTQDPFRVLGLPPTADEAQIKAAYRTLARRLHPDAGGNDAAFQKLRDAADLATAYATGTKPNPYLPTEDHTMLVSGYDRHSHAPKPPPNVWNGTAWYWILPVAGVIFMVSGATGPYFLPVFAASMAAYGLIVWLVLRR